MKSSVVAGWSNCSNLQAESDVCLDTSCCRFWASHSESRGIPYNWYFLRTRSGTGGGIARAGRQRPPADWVPSAKLFLFVASRWLRGLCSEGVKTVVVRGFERYCVAQLARVIFQGTEAEIHEVGVKGLGGWRWGGHWKGRERSEKCVGGLTSALWYNRTGPPRARKDGSG